MGLRGMRPPARVETGLARDGAPGCRGARIVRHTLHGRPAAAAPRRAADAGAVAGFGDRPLASRLPASRRAPRAGAAGRERGGPRARGEGPPRARDGTFPGGDRLPGCGPAADRAGLGVPLGFPGPPDRARARPRVLPGLQRRRLHPLHVAREHPAAPVAALRLELSRRGLGRGGGNRPARDSCGDPRLCARRHARRPGRGQGGGLVGAGNPGGIGPEHVVGFDGPGDGAHDAVGARPRLGAGRRGVGARLADGRPGCGGVGVEPGLRPGDRGGRRRLARLGSPALAGGRGISGRRGGPAAAVVRARVGAHGQPALRRRLLPLLWPIGAGLLLAALASARARGAWPAGARWLAALWVGLWLWSVGYTAGGLSYSLRVLSPALALVSVAGGVALSRVRGRWRGALAAGLLLLAAEASARALVMMRMPLAIPGRAWALVGTRFSALRGDSTCDRAAAIIGTSRVLVDSAYTHAFLAERRVAAVPPWSPGLDFLRAPGIDMAAAVRRLRAMGVDYIWLTAAPDLRGYFDRYAFYQGLDPWLRPVLFGDHWVLFAIRDASSK